jgi:hypothetical protein
MALVVSVTCNPGSGMDYRIETDDGGLIWQRGFVEFTDLPRSTRLMLEPCDDRVELTLMAFDDWPILPSAVGDPVGALDVRLRTFAGAVLSAGQRLSEDRQAYEQGSRYEFPGQRLTDLAATLKAT